MRVYEKSTASSQQSDIAKPSELDIHAEMSAAQTTDGSVILISVRVPQSLEGKPVSGEFEGIELPFFKDGEMYRAVLGIPYDHKAGLASVKVRVGAGKDAKAADASFSITPGDYESEVLKVDGRRVQPQNPKDLARITREQVEIGKAYAEITQKKYWSGPFELPIKSQFTSRFGTRRVYNGIQKSAHLGLDFRAAIGTPIHSAAPGKVVLAKNLFFTGNTVIVDHGYGVMTLYAHMSKIKVKKGQEVLTGALLGLSGKTGRVNGPHLHWMAIVQKQKVNPLGLTQVMK